MLVWLPFLLACRPDCDSTRRWSEIPVSSARPDDFAHQLAGLRVESALRQVAAWSDLPEVCVSEVEVRDEAEIQDGYRTAGSYTLPDARVQVSPYSIDVWETTVHELCHAIDETVGISQDHPDLFPEDEVPDLRDYRGRHLQAEAFARLCDDGARDHLRWQQAAACGHPMTDIDMDAVAFVQETVYPWAVRLPWDQGELQVEALPGWRLPVPPGWRHDESAVQDDSIVVLWQARPDGRQRGHRLTWHAWDTGAEQARLDLPCTSRDWCAARLVPGDEGPLLDRGDALWTLAPGLLGAPLACATAEVVVAGEAWGFDPDGDDALLRCDPATGASTRVALPPPSFNLTQQYRLFSDPSEIGWAGDGPTVRYPDAGLSRRRADGAFLDLPLPWHLSVHDTAPSPDGTHLVLLLETNDLDGAALRYLAAVDLAALDLAAMELGDGTGDGEAGGPDRLLAPRDPCPLPLPGDLREGELHAGDGWAVVEESPAGAGEAPRFTPYALTFP